MRSRRILAVLSSAAFIAFTAGAIAASPAEAARFTHHRPLDADPTNTTLSFFPTNDIFWGLEDQVQMNVSVTGGDSGGNFTISGGGQTLCGGTLSNHLGTCHVASATMLAAGAYTLTAVYSGDENSQPSSDSESFTVSPPPTTTILTLSANRATFGGEQSENLSVSVTPSAFIAGTPSGTVTLNHGSSAIATINLVNGAANMTLGPTQVKPGRYTITASYSGDGTFVSSTSDGEPLIIAKEHTTTTLKLSAARVKLGRERSERFTVQVSPTLTGPAPTGKVTVKAGSRRVCTITLARGKGRCNLTTARQLRPGTYKITASYAGSDRYVTSTSQRKLTVTK
jgi:large repetitive protein